MLQSLKTALPTDPISRGERCSYRLTACLQARWSRQIGV